MKSSSWALTRIPTCSSSGPTTKAVAPCFTVDLRDPGLKRTLRLAHPEQDLAGHLIRSQLSGEIVGFVADGDADGDAPSTEFWIPN